MGFASQPFAVAPWGADAVAAPSAQVSTTASPTALAFDIGTKSFLQNADGTMKSIHPVDQEVNLALGIEAGAIASAVDVGHRMRRILRASGPTVAAAARDEVNRVLARLLARRDIKLLGVDVDTTTRGRIVAIVRYVNLRTGAVQNAKVK
jgi:hypothetical protein